MEAIQKRQKLHEYIDLADDEQVNALFIILNADSSFSYQYSAEDIKMFDERRNKYLKGEGKNFSFDESFDEVRKKS